VPEALARATGRRKEAVCRARLLPGEGRWTINGRPFEDYFANATHRMIITEPLRLTNTEGRYDIIAKIEGGGIAGQAGSLRHAITRALVELDPDLRPILKKAGFLTRDAREKERRKYGLKKARKAPQYSKR
jgi:small subunit ribosomal protein S9